MHQIESLGYYFFFKKKKKVLGVFGKAIWWIFLKLLMNFL
jgi:hypothetical protein